MYREEQSGASFVLGMMTGAFIGAGVALLFAPKSGHEMRQQLGEQYRGLADARRRNHAEPARKRAARCSEQGRERVQQADQPAVGPDVVLDRTRGQLRAAVRLNDSRRRRPASEQPPSITSGAFTC